MLHIPFKDGSSVQRSGGNPRRKKSVAVVNETFVSARTFEAKIPMGRRIKLAGLESAWRIR